MVSPAVGVFIERAGRGDPEMTEPIATQVVK
ncbi:Uncharacterised protein [Vibrio cholerae]|nr:Uncharacterised protein [Vibrio cholerae]